MADVAMGNLRFDLTADNSSFMAAVRQAKDAQNAAAAEMGSKFAEASSKAEQAVSKMAETLKVKSLEAMRNIIELGRGIGSALAKGGEEAETAIAEVFSKQFKGGFDKAWSATASKIAGAGQFGKIAAGIMTGLEAIGLKDMIRDKLAPSIAGGLDTILEKLNASNWGAAISGIFPASMATDVQERVDGWVESIRAALQRLAGTWTGVSEQVKKAAEEMAARTKVVEFQTGLIGMDVGAKAAAVARETQLRSIGKAYGDLNEAEKEELATQEKAAAMAAIDQAARNRGVDAVKKYEDAIESLRKKNAEATFQNNMLGSSTAQKAEAAELARVLDQLGTTWERLTEKQKLAVSEQARIAGVRAQEREEYQKSEQDAKAYEQAVASLTIALKRQGQMALANAGRGFGKSAYQRSLEEGQAQTDAFGRGRFPGLATDQRVLDQNQETARDRQAAANRNFDLEIQRSIKEQSAAFGLQTQSLGKTVAEAERLKFAQEQLNKAEREGVVVTDALRAKIDAQARTFGGASQARANAAYAFELQRSFEEAAQRGANDIAGIGQSVGEVERLRVEYDLQNKAKREGVTLDEATRQSIASTASAMGRIAQATAEARERFEAFREVGRTVASSLEDAFSRFIGGTQVQWKEFIGGLQADLAKLAFRRGIESLLTGGVASGGGLMAGLAGLFGGFRADGGSVNAGKSYIVGERGPEMFVPQGAGSIVSNQALMSGGAGPTTINMHVDLTGANGDETIRRISRAAAIQAASQAVQQANDAMPQRQRQLQLLGT